MTSTSTSAPSLNAPRTTRGVTHTQSYGPLLRIADCVAGWRDRRQIGPNTGPDGAIVTPYSRRLQATFDENDRGALARLQDLCRPSATKLRELIAGLDRLDAQITEARSSLDQMPTAPTSEELMVRNGGELHFEPQAVRVRRSREHAARIACARNMHSRLLVEYDRHQIDCARHTARLGEEFELARSVSVRLREYYNRRLASYARSARIPGSGTPTIQAPLWTTRPCPWLPPDMTRALNPGCRLQRAAGATT